MNLKLLGQRLWKSVADVWYQTAALAAPEKVWVWYHITRGNGQPYMDRLTLIKVFGYKLMIHVFHDSDDECLHDHPWTFLSFILWGGYWETTPERRRWFGPGSLLYRPATWVHRVELGLTKPITLVLAGKRNRDWGFYTPGGWVNADIYSHEEHCS